MMQPLNPYIAGNPLKNEEQFFGRGDTVQWVRQGLLNPMTNALVLFGQRRIGKTTLLLQLERILAKENFLPIYFDLQDQARRPLGEVLVDLADVVTERTGLPLPVFDDVEDKRKSFQRDFLPHLYQGLEENCRPVFLLDEFDVLQQTSEEALPENVATRALFPFLRGLMNDEPPLAFVFAVGRRAEDLSIDFSSIFKGALVRELWVLDRESAISLIKQAQDNHSLRFTNPAIERILSLAGRHPYMTQLLCQQIWNRAYVKGTTVTPTVEASDINAAVPDVLETGQSAFNWIWGGFNPAERVYAAALAEATQEGQEVILEDKVVEVLGSHAARLRAQPVEIAPRELVRRRVLEAAELGGYRFAVELFRRWVRRYKPLRDVKDELDKMYPEADEFFNIGQRIFNQGDWEKAIGYFRDALETDPRHFHAQLQLGEALLELGQVNEAVEELKRAYELDQRDARFSLARALVTRARLLNKDGNEDAALAACARALEVSPGEKTAQEIKKSIWVRRGNAAMERGERETALAAYQQAGAEGWEDAIVFVRNALESDPARFRSRFYLGEVLLDLERPEEAMAQLDAALAGYQQTGFDFAKAIDFFRKLVRREPQNAFGYLHLGVLLKAKGKTDEAGDQLRRAYELDAEKAEPYFVDALMKQAQAAGEDENWPGALDAYLRVLEIDPARQDVLGAMKETVTKLHDERVKAARRAEGGQEHENHTYVTRRIERNQMIAILNNAQRKVRLLGVVALDIMWSDVVGNWAEKLNNTRDFEITVQCESDNLLFAKSFTLDTDKAANRRSFRELKFVRDRAFGLSALLRSEGIRNGRINGRVRVEIMHLPLPITIAQIDDRIFANLWLHEIESYFEEITGEHPWYPLIERYITTYFDPERGRKYAADPTDELLVLYDHDRIPRGIYPRASFYDTDHSQLVVWAFVFDRQGRLLIHRRSDNAKDNQGMWDKSVGGHVEFTDYHTSQAAYREVIEELFTEEPEDIKSDLRKWKISDEEVIYLGDWRPDRRGWFPFQEIRSYEREWAFFRLRDVEGFERLYSPRTLPDGSERRLRVIPDIFLFVAGPQLNEGRLRRLKNSTYKLTQLTHLKSVMDRAIADEEVPGFDENRFDEDEVNAIPKFTPDLRNIMTGKLRDVLEDFSQYIKRYIAT